MGKLIQIAFFWQGAKMEGEKVEINRQVGKKYRINRGLGIKVGNLGGK